MKRKQLITVISIALLTFSWILSTATPQVALTHTRAIHEHLFTDEGAHVPSSSKPRDEFTSKRTSLPRKPGSTFPASAEEEQPAQATRKPFQIAQAAEIAEGEYQIIAKHSNKCVDVESVSQNDGANVFQWDCYGSDNQIWTLNPSGGAYQIVSKNSNKCLDIAEFSTEDGGNVQQWSCSGSDNQLWELQSSGDGYRIVSKHSNKCLDVDEFSTEDGANVQQWSCSGGENQTFSLSRVGSSEDALQGVWGQVSQLRDTKTQWPDDKPDVKRDKPAGGWYVTPIHATLLPNGKVLLAGWERRDESGCGEDEAREKSVTFLLDPDKVVNGKTIEIEPIAENMDAPTNDYSYCGGHTPMHDGKFLFAGGSYYEDKPEYINNAMGTDWGLGYSRIFSRFGNNEAGEFYQTSAHNLQSVHDDHLQFANENSRRKWYPTATRLSTTGKILVTGGFFKYPDEQTNEDSTNKSVEVYDSESNTWNMLWQDATGLKEMAPAPSDYTHTFVLHKPVPRWLDPVKNRQVLMFGAYGQPLYFNLNEEGTLGGFGKPENPRPTSLNIEEHTRAVGSSSALLANGKVAMMGHKTDTDLGKSLDVFNPYANDGTGQWEESKDMGTRRSYSNLVLLPDTSILTINGETPAGVNDNVQSQAAVRQPTLFNPLGQWPYGPRQLADSGVNRGYHSFALLLKDGRILVGGGRNDGHHIRCEEPNVQIYTPFYLDTEQRGPQPTILWDDRSNNPIKFDENGQQTLSFSQEGGPNLRPYQESNGIPLSSGVVMMALGSVTHGFDQNQRIVPLNYSQDGNTITVYAPTDWATNNRTIAPAGDYILFLVNNNGAVSAGKALWYP